MGIPRKLELSFGEGCSIPDSTQIAGSIYMFIINFMIFIKINSFLNKFGPLWAHKGPYGPIRALMGPILVKKLIILMKNNKIIHKNIKIVNLEFLRVKTWFGDKDLFS